MSEGVIQLSDALEAMQQTDRNGDPIPFSIEWYKYSAREEMNGEKKILEAAEMVFVKNSKVIKTKTAIKGISNSKSPKHWKNSTRNIRVPGSDQLIKIHIWLITKYNGKRIVWNILG